MTSMIERTPEVTAPVAGPTPGRAGGRRECGGRRWSGSASSRSVVGPLFPGLPRCAEQSRSTCRGAHVPSARNRTLFAGPALYGGRRRTRSFALGNDGDGGDRGRHCAAILCARTNMPRAARLTDDADSADRHPAARDHSRWMAIYGPGCYLPQGGSKKLRCRCGTVVDPRRSLLGPSLTIPVVYPDRAGRTRRDRTPRWRRRAAAAGEGTVAGNHAGTLPMLRPAILKMTP